jgi:DUF4097 and DUF4098 domain-containing protein YvlB
MSMKAAVLPAVAILALGAAMSARPLMAGDDTHFDRTLSVTGSVDLDVQTGSGEITVRTGDSSKVEIHGRIHANHGWGGDVANRIQEIAANPPIEQSGNTIRVGHMESRDEKNNISISYEIVVPAQAKVKAQSGSGDERIEGVAGTVDANSGSGSVKLAHIGSEVHARTGSGDIELTDIHGAAQATAGSGSIRADGVAGGFTASSGSGDVRLQESAPGDVEIGTGSGEVTVKGANGAVKVQTGSGGVTVDGNPAGEWRLRTGSGDVAVVLPPTASFNLVARTGSGSIDSTHTVAVQGKTNPHTLEGKVGNGGPTVELSTSSGSIQIH